MGLSISIFRGNFMRSLWKILAGCALITYGLCVIYTLFINAEARFWTQALKKKTQWVEKMDAEPGGKVIFAGGSTAFFAFQSKRIYEERKIKSVNMGMTVAMGTPFLCAIAYDAARKDDILVLLLEPNLLTKGHLEPTALSVQTALLSGDVRHAFGWPVWEVNKDWGLMIGSMRPGAQHVTTALLKAVFRRPEYRYPQSNVDESGYLWMPGRDESWAPFGGMREMTLSDKGRDLLKFLKARSEEKGVILYYAIPWVLCKPEFLDMNRSVHRKLMEEVSKYILVIDDEFSGCLTDESLFYDQVHLSKKGAVMRTDMLLDALITNRFVTLSTD